MRHGRPFKAFNSATLIGNAKVGQYWVLSFDADHRRSPLLQLSNALIGQNALDRTSISNTFVLSASRPLGERWQFMADIGAIELSGTPASLGFGMPLVGAVEATQSTGLDKNATLQIAGSSLMQASDLQIFSARWDKSPSVRSATVSWDARFVVHGAWRLGPRLSVEKLNTPAQGGNQTLYLPQLRSDWTSRRSVFEATAGYQILNQQALQQQQIGPVQVTAVEQRSLYVSAAYRLRF